MKSGSLCGGVFADVFGAESWVDEAGWVLSSGETHGVAMLDDTAEVREMLLGCVGRRLRIPEAFAPSREYLAFHRERVFRSG